MTHEPSDLTGLREAIADVDRALVELLRRRMQLASEVGRVKAAAGAPVVVRDVENRVLARARENAATCGVSEEVMEAIFHAIMRGSVERQYRVGVEARASRGVAVLVLGGAGAMGGWLRRFLASGGHKVDIVDPSLAGLPLSEGAWPSLGDVPDLSRYAAIVVSVPLAATPAVLAEVVARRPAALVVEIASIKSHLSDVLTGARAGSLRVASLHPMFGPGKSLYEPLTFVLACHDGPDEERARIEPLLRHPYASLIAIPFAHHDRLMGWLLGLAHLTGMVFGSALARSGLSTEELQACASTTFLRQASTASSILAEDPDLYLDIQRLNPHRDVVYGAAREALEELVGAVGAADREAFRDALAAARQAVIGNRSALERE
jgi:chorismate mutase / prephenate dehydrogenase